MINFRIDNPSTGSKASVTVDVGASLLSYSGVGVSSEMDYFLKVTTNSKDLNGQVPPAKIAKGLDTLALGTKQRVTDTASDYTDVKALVLDYVYDIVNGHTAGLYSTSVTEQSALNLGQ